MSVELAITPIHLLASSCAAGISPMRMTDIDTVLAHEKLVSAYPWNQQNFADSLRVGHEAWVMREGDDILAWALLSRVLDEAELLLIGVAKSRQRGGLGRQMMNFVCAWACHAGVTRIFLEVRVSNVAARGLYAQCGFVHVGCRRNYYPASEGREDALLLACDL